MNLKPHRLLALAGLAFGCVVPVFGQSSINLFPMWDQASSIGNFGEEAPTSSTFVSATYGQTFVVPTGYDQLDNFTFALQWTGGASVDFAAYVSQWDSSKITGPLLYSSAPQTLAANTPGFVPFTFQTSNLLLDPAKTYVAFLSASNFFDGTEDFASMGALGDIYAGGKFVYFNNANNFSLLQTSEWEGIGAKNWGDAAFAADFSASPNAPAFVAVPEPSTYGVIGVLALGGLIGLRRFRSRTKA